MQTPSLEWKDLYWYGKAAGILLFSGWMAHHYVNKFTENMKEFMRDMVAELIRSTDAKLKYRDSQTQIIKQELNKQKHRVTALSLATLELSTELLLPGPLPMGHDSRVEMIRTLQNIATQRSIEPEDQIRIEEE